MKHKLMTIVALAATAVATVTSGQFGDFGKLKGVEVPGFKKPAGTDKLLDLGEKGFEAVKAYSGADRDKYGQTVALAATNKFGGLDDRSLVQSYVTLVGLTVAKVADPDEKKGRFVFGVLNSDEPAAYSGPGGYVMITRGALKLISDESELAGVLAHEIAHVVKDHGLAAVQRQKSAALAQAMASDKMGSYQQLSDVLIDTTLTKPFSRDEEASADKLAVMYLDRAGYDPNGYLRFLKKLVAAKGNAGTGVFATHPSTKDRIKDVEKAAKGTGGATNADRFSRMTAP